jgi:hypothetical protein
MRPRKPGSYQTLRWREVDSNHRYLAIRAALKGLIYLVNSYHSGTQLLGLLPIQFENAPTFHLRIEHLQRAAAERTRLCNRFQRDIGRFWIVRSLIYGCYGPKNEPCPNGVTWSTALIPRGELSIAGEFTGYKKGALPADTPLWMETALFSAHTIGSGNLAAPMFCARAGATYNARVMDWRRGSG